MAGYYSSNPMIGRSLSGLAQALSAGRNPLQDAQAAEIGDRRRKLEAERGLLTQQITGEEIKNREAQDILDRRDLAVPGLQSAGGVDPGMASLLAALLGKSNFKDATGGLNQLNATRLGAGTPDQMRQSLALQGKMPDSDTALSFAESGDIRSQDQAASLAEVVRQAGIQAGAQRYNTDVDAATARDIEQSRSGTAKFTAAMQGLRGRSGKADAPKTYKTSPAEANKLQDQTLQTLAGILQNQQGYVGDKIDPETLLSQIDPALLSQIMREIAGQYTASGDALGLQSQVPQILQQLGIAPQLESEGMYDSLVGNKDVAKFGQSYPDENSLKLAVQSGKLDRQQAAQIARARGWIQ